MKFFKALMILTAVISLVAVARAQEGEAKMVDEVVARVNTSYIMLSTYRRAQQDLLEELKARGLKDQELEKKFNELKPIILDQLIDQQLLAQRAKELSIDVEPLVNEQLRRIMDENKIKTLEELEQKMREAGIDLNEVKQTLKERFLADRVRGAEVYGKIYRALTEKEKRDYYEKHKEWFTIPGEVTLRYILISLGKDPAQALKRAQEIAIQARSGAADFIALVQRYSEDEKTKPAGGLLGTIKLPDLAKDVAEAIGNSPAGTVTDPVKLETGYAIYRIDQRKETTVKPFEDREVQEVVANRLTYERGEAEMEAYLQKLRNDAFIEIDPRYQLAESKIKTFQIKRIPYSEEDRKERKKREKKEKEKAAGKTTPGEKP